MNAFERYFGKWVVKHRWMLLALTVAMVALTSAGIPKLGFNNDTRVFFSKDNPQLQALEALEHTYTRNQGIFFALAPRDQNVFSHRVLAAVEELTKKSWQIPYSSRVDSITNFQHIRAEGDELIVADLVENAKEFSASELARVRAVAVAEPLLVNRLVSPAGHVTGINVNTLLPGESTAEVTEVALYVQKLAEEFRLKYPDIDLHVLGGVAVDHAFAEASQDDMTTLVPLMYLVLVIIVGASLRSVVGTLATLAVILLSMVTGMGVAGWLGISITSASVNAPTIILTLAVADSVHLLATTFQVMRCGTSKHEAIAESLRINLRAVFLTSITTAVGFLSMNFSDAPPFRDLGNIVAIGVIAAFSYSVLTLPALVAVLPVRVTGNAQKGASPVGERIAQFVIGHYRVLLWSSIPIIAVISLGILRVELNDNFIEYFSRRYTIRRATDFVQSNLTGAEVIEYSLESGEEGGITNPEYLRTIDQFAQWYRRQPKVVHVHTISDTIKRLNRSMHGNDPNYYRIPESRELVAQYLLLYEFSLPFGLDLNDRLNVDKSAARFVVTLADTDTSELREMDNRARLWLESNAPPHMFTYGSGLSIIWAHISERNINNMLIGAVGALILISIALILAFKDVKIGLLSLIPNIAPAVVAFGAWGLTVGRVGLGLSIVASLTIGIVVDDTIHFLTKYLLARRQSGFSPKEAVRYAFHRVSTPMWITTLALAAGFTVLTFSGYRMNSDMGIMSALTIVLALAMDFLLLPSLLIQIEETSHEHASDNLEITAGSCTTDLDNG